MLLILGNLVSALSVVGCVVVGTLWGSLNYVQKKVSISNHPRKNLYLGLLFLCDKLSSLLYIASVQSIALSLASVLANGTSILAAYFTEKGTKFFTY